MRVKRNLGRSAIGIAAVAVTAALAPAAAFGGHFLLDHPTSPLGAVPIPAPTFQSGGEGAEWELVTTLATGNPHTDLDYFTQGGEIYASVGTLAIGPNAGGQTIVKLTEGGEVTTDSPSFVSAHPSASCLSDPNAALGLQHDVEASPKGNTLLNTPNPFAVRTDAQVLVDASDAGGRCHDQGVLGLSGAPPGGLEIVDVTDIENPVEIGLTSHIGESHTVNVDPKRPHIAYSVTSDSVSVDDAGVRANEDPASGNRFNLDGFEVVDLSTCMDFPAGATLETKRATCRPEVYRYRFPTAEMALGHTLKSSVYGCHELEVYPDDRLTCASGSALIELEMSGAFDNMGTPTDYSDDKPRGTPLPCKTRASSSTPGFQTGATIVDCVDGTNDAADVGGVAGDEDLTIPGWIAQGSPSLEGVEYVGSIHHMGRGAGGAATPAYDSTEDIDFNHEAELTGSGENLIATDERGGGVLPPGATCLPGVDNAAGNGGVHFYDRDAVKQGPVGTPEEEFEAYALTPEGEKAIFRAQVRTQPRATICTAHVFQQIPGENRIFMAWYSQGTQVIDFVENADGTVTFAEAGYFIPAQANEWVSSVFKTQQNSDGSTTYWGATGDFTLGEAGRNAIDVYKVTLPPAPKAGTPGSGGSGGEGSGGDSRPGASGPGSCAQSIRGSKSGEKLLGSIAGDRIRGRGGADKINGRDGEDCVNGGGGKDKVTGDTENDTVKGGRGADKLKGGKGSDKLSDRSDGRDRLNAGKGRDLVLTKGGGRDKVNCGKGRDRAVVDKRDRTKGCEKVKVKGGR